MCKWNIRGLWAGQGEESCLWKAQTSGNVTWKTSRMCLSDVAFCAWHAAGELGFGWRLKEALMCPQLGEDRHVGRRLGWQSRSPSAGGHPTVPSWAVTLVEQMLLWGLSLRQPQRTRVPSIWCPQWGGTPGIGTAGWRLERKSFTKHLLLFLREGKSGCDTALPVTLAPSKYQWLTQRKVYEALRFCLFALNSSSKSNNINRWLQLENPERNIVHKPEVHVCLG